MKGLKMMEKRKSEQGNVLFLILLAVVLFAALGFAVTRGSNTSNQYISEEQASLSATEVIEYGNSIRSVADQMFMLKGVSDTNVGGNGILFSASGASADYGVAGAQPNTEIFNAAGGAAVYQQPSSNLCQIESCAYEFTGQYKILGVGSDSKSELVMVLAGVDSNVCKAINKSLLGWTDIPNGDTLYLTRFNGANYGENGAANPIVLSGAGNVFVGRRAFCYRESGGSNRNIFLQVIKPR